MLDGVVLGAIGRIMGHAQFQTQLVGQALQMILEDVTIAGVAATAVAQEQQATCLRIGGSAMGSATNTRCCRRRIDWCRG
jgi:hypothetical protein